MAGLTTTQNINKNINNFDENPNKINRPIPVKSKLVDMPTNTALNN